MQLYKCFFIVIKSYKLLQLLTFVIRLHTWHLGSLFIIFVNINVQVKLIKYLLSTRKNIFTRRILSFYFKINYYFTLILGNTTGKN